MPDDQTTGDRDALGRLTRRPPTRLGPDGQPLPRKRKGPTRFKHFKIDELLAPEHHDAYEALVDDPTSTLPRLQGWLREHGVVVSLNAVSNHRTHRFLDLKGMRETSQMASAFCALSRKFGPGVIAEATHAKLEMMVMEALFKSKKALQVPTADWQAMSKLVTTLLDNRRNVEEMREDADRRAREVVDLAQRAIGKKFDGKIVVQRMKEILGV